MKTIPLALLILSTLAFAQTKQTTKVTAPHKPTVLERLDKLEASLQETVKSRDDLKEENDRLKAANKELSDSNIALAAKYEELRKAGLEVLNFGIKASSEYDKLTAKNAALVTSYNALLTRANEIIESQNAMLSRRAQINNAIAMYSMMPRYTPTPLPQPQVFTSSPQTLNLQTTCTSNKVGDSTYTTCR